MCRRAHRHVQLVLDRAADLLLQRRGTHQGKQPLHDARALGAAGAERDDHVIISTAALVVPRWPRGP